MVAQLRRAAGDAAAAASPRRDRASATASARRAATSAVGDASPRRAGRRDCCVRVRLDRGHAAAGRARLPRRAGGANARHVGDGRRRARGAAGRRVRPRLRAPPGDRAAPTTTSSARCARAGDVDEVRAGETRRRRVPTAPATPASREPRTAATGDGGRRRHARARQRGAAAAHVRIDLRRLDTLMNLIGELVITRGRLAQLAGAIDDPALDRDGRAGVAPGRPICRTRS